VAPISPADRATASNLCFKEISFLLESE